VPVTGFSETEPETVEQRRFERLIDLSPSAKLVFRVLQEESPLLPGEISTRTLLPDRTTRYALNKLKATDLVTERPCPVDVRKQLYAARSVTRPEDRPTDAADRRNQTAEGES